MRWPVHSALHPEVDFELQMSFFEDGNARVQMDQVGERYKNWKRYDQTAMWTIVEMPSLADKIEAVYDRSRHTTTVRWSAHANEMVLEHEPLRISFKRDGIVQMILNDRNLLHMEHFRPRPDPFPSIKHEEDEEEAASARRLQKRTQEISAAHKRLKKPDQNTIHAWAGFEQEDSGEWEETWARVKDSKPKGPEAVGLDVSFPGYGIVYGLPEHASPMSLRSTRVPPAGSGSDEELGRYTDPYRLMNTDVFEYDYDSPMALYGSAPILHAQSKGSAVSVLWLNSAETWVDLHKSKRRPGPQVSHSKLTESSSIDSSMMRGGSASESSHAHFFSEAGILDLFVFLGPSPEVNMERFTSLVGRTALPQYFALGYHQSRWNYLTDTDVIDTSNNFDLADMPMDVMWLDIEYSRDHMYGVWDKRSFKNPKQMVDNLDEVGRKLVIIIDPHLKKTESYYLYKEAKDRRLLVRKADGVSDYVGECWSKDASWIDMFNPNTWKWWIDQHSLSLNKLEANARNLFIWNDMSEPAIFDGPEVTSPKDNIHYPHFENRDLHNLNGIVMQNLTSTGLVKRELGTKDKYGHAGVERRPFVLSRAWWLGSQRFGAIWTGDNLGTWEHFAGTVPMLLQNGLGGMSFCGADIGGFFGDPDEELLLRWYQAGIFEPFFRAHAHIDTKRREPFLFSGKTGDSLRALLQLRYRLLPVWYTAFWNSWKTGLPVLVPQHIKFPHDERGFTMDNQYYIGNSGLLFKPAVSKGAKSVNIYLAEDQLYYDYFTKHEYRGSPSGINVTIPAPLTGQVPLLIRGGSLLPTYQRNRRAAELQRGDPLTLYVALARNRQGVRARGQLYMDDGQTFAYRDHHAYIARDLQVEQDHGVHRLTCSSLEKAGDALSTQTNPYVEEFRTRVERIVILGLEDAPHYVQIRNSNGDTDQLDFSWVPTAKVPGSADDSSNLRTSELVIRDPRALIAEDWTIEWK
ncbi:glucan 1,3-alpha-glucosidase [Malassezia psittaci]|uniref:Glucosidase II subunit alpha n=1 Tax=Malassezia psittaci TaxID=1821823 RepID=A0AAF0JF45_9BASI|nr:glucan 1,3-alpha-glucosidase [Malassezia psittaci]